MADLKGSIISSATKILEKAARGETIDDNEMTIIIMAINMDRRSKEKPIGDYILKYGKKFSEIMNEMFPVEKGE